MKLHFVYVARAADGHPLYVGRTSNIHLRLKAHHSQAAWWSDGVTFELTPAYDIIEATQRERALIAALRPDHNIIWHPDAAVQPAERGTLLTGVLDVLAEAGQPLSTSEIRAQVRYQFTPALLQRLHRLRKVKPVAYVPARNATGYLAYWALAEWSQPELARPERRVA